VIIKFTLLIQAEPLQFHAQEILLDQTQFRTWLLLVAVAVLKVVVAQGAIEKVNLVLIVIHNLPLLHQEAFLFLLKLIQLL
jgi:hypothetical protein